MYLIDTFVAFGISCMCNVEIRLTEKCLYSLIWSTCNDHRVDRSVAVMFENADMPAVNNMCLYTYSCGSMSFFVHSFVF